MGKISSPDTLPCCFSCFQAWPIWRKFQWTGRLVLPNGCLLFKSCRLRSEPFTLCFLSQRFNVFPPQIPPFFPQLPFPQAPPLVSRVWEVSRVSLGVVTIKRSGPRHGHIKRKVVSCSQSSPARLVAGVPWLQVLVAQSTGADSADHKGPRLCEQQPLWQHSWLLLNHVVARFSWKEKFPQVSTTEP